MKPIAKERSELRTYFGISFLITRNGFDIVVVGDGEVGKGCGVLLLAVCAAKLR
jgi:hypothetical protein